MNQDDMPTSEEITEALDIARQLIKAGVPVFAAPPCPEGCARTDRKGRPHRGGPGRYHLPPEWQKTVPSLVNLERFEPGWALGAVGGRVADFLDVDPRSGGTESFAELLAAGHVPQTFGQQGTPSGGQHHVIAGTGERKVTGFMPGLDLQAGEHGKGDGRDGDLGRGFVYIAPTVRRSKNPADAGALKAYRWIEPPDLEALDDAGQSARDSNQGLISRIRAHEARPRAHGRRTDEPRPDAHDTHDPFMDASMSGGSFGGDRAFTLAEAQEFVGPYLIDLRQAKIGSIEDTCNIAATVLFHFIPAFWTVDQGMMLLEDALSKTAYDPSGPGEWEAEKFRDVLDGSRPPHDPWKAIRKADPPPPRESVTVEAETPEEENLSPLDRLRRRLISGTELAKSPNPEPLVHGLLDLDTECWMIGAPGSLKSFIALDIAGHVAAGRPWWGHRVTRRKVLYIAAEGQRGMVLRSRAWISRYGPMDDVIFLPYPVKAKNTVEWGALVTIAKELQPGLIVIDTQARIAVGLEENSATEMSTLTDATGQLKRASKACVLVIHHTGRNGKDARGSSAIDGAQDTELKVERGTDADGLALICRIKQDKQKDMAMGGEPLTLELESVDLGRDEHTGRALSSLVVAGEGDPFRAGEGFTAEQAEPWLTPEKTAHQPWTLMPEHEIKAQAITARRILQVFEDHTPGNEGLTEAGVWRILKFRWPNEKHTRGNFDSWMAKIKSNLPDLIVKLQGQRWGIDELELRKLREAGDRQ